jgi:carbamoyl-phosphate synthase large subunit
MIGAKAEVIDKAEDRQKFRDAMDKLGLESPKSKAAHNMDEALRRPGVRRPAGHHPPVLHPGGTGGGIAYNRRGVREIVERGLDLSPTTEVLIEESVLGWKEYEMEVVRDKADNCIIVCSIENIDPMGVHTGDSITVAPALTLTDKEYQMDARRLDRRAARDRRRDRRLERAVRRQSGRRPHGRHRDEPARVALVGAGLQGHRLPDRQGRRPPGRRLHAGRAEERHHRRRDARPRSSPAIDYVVTKIPRFAFEKFPGAEPTADHRHEVGRRGHGHRPHLQGIVQKALRGLETGLTGSTRSRSRRRRSRHRHAAVIRALGTPTPDRLRMVAQAFRHGLTVEEINAACKIEPWFLRQIADLSARKAGPRRRPADRRRRPSAP